MGFKAAAKAFFVPKTTLVRHYKSQNKLAKQQIVHFGTHCALTTDMEEEIVRHVVDLQDAMFPITKADLQRLAFQLAERNGLSTAFSKNKGIAGQKWYAGFLKRHPELSIRRPEATSLARADGFNKEAVNKYFRNVNEIVTKHKLDGTKVYNMERANHEPVFPVTQRVPATMISPIPTRKRKQRSNDTSIVLTTSPYKTQLTNKTPRDKTRVQKQKEPNVRGNKVGENKKGKKQKSKSRSSDPSWVCSLYGDCSVESMICCVLMPELGACCMCRPRCWYDNVLLWHMCMKCILFAISFSNGKTLRQMQKLITYRMHDQEVNLDIYWHLCNLSKS